MEILFEPSALLSSREKMISYLMEVRSVNSLVADFLGYIFTVIGSVHMAGGYTSYTNENNELH